MTISYTITADDYVRANQRHCGLVYRSRRGLIVPVSAGAIWSGIILLDVQRSPAERIAWFVVMLLGFAALLWLLIVGLNKLLLPRRARKIHAQTRALQGSHGLSWDDDALSFANERGDQRLPWTDFITWTDGSDGLMLYVSDLLFYALPSRDVSAAARAEIKRLLLAHAVPEWRAWQLA